MPFNPDEFVIDAERSLKSMHQSMDGRLKELEHGAEIIDKARAPYVEKLRAQIERDREAGEAMAQLKAQIEAHARRLDSFQKGEISRAEVVKEGRKDWVEALGPRAFAAIKNAHQSLGERAPLVPDEALPLLFGKKELPDDWIARFIGHEFTFYEPVEVGTIKQGLGDDPVPLPNIDQCFTGAYDKQETATSAQMLSFPIAVGTPGSRRFFTSSQSVGSAFPSWGWGRATVGTDLVVPPGFTKLQVTADIDYMASFSSGAVLATGSVASGELLMKIVFSDGSEAEGKSTVGVNVSGVVTWGSASATGNRLVTTTLNIPSTGGKARLLAGAQSTSTCGPGLVVWATADVSGTINSICVVAT